MIYKVCALIFIQALNTSYILFLFYKNRVSTLINIKQVRVVKSGGSIKAFVIVSDLLEHLSQ